MEPQKTKAFSVRRLSAGLYEVRLGQQETWEVWRGVNGGWYGESADHPNLMIDAPTLRCAKFDVEQRFFVECAGAGT